MDTQTAYQTKPFDASYFVPETLSFWDKVKRGLYKALPAIGAISVVGGAAVGGYYAGRRSGFSEGYDHGHMDGLNTLELTSNPIIYAD